MGSHHRSTMKRFAIIAGMALAAVGGPGAPGAWGQCAANELAKLSASDAAAGDFFGRSVSISGDVALIGAHGNDDAGSGTGAAYAYRLDPEGSGQWVQEQKLTASDAAAGEQFGRAVSVSGNVAVVGAWFDDDACPDDPFCWSGSAYIFRFDPQTSRWNEEAKLTASDAAPFDFFGVSVSISGDAALIGAPQFFNGGPGAAYVYRFNRTTGVWVEQAKLTAFDAEAHDQFGFSVSISRDVTVIGALNEGNCCGPFPADGPGAAYLYRFDHQGSGQWVHEQKLTASDGEAGDRFTESVSISGDTIVIGAAADDDAGPHSGSAYIYRFDPDGSGQWVQEQKLTASDGAPDDDFGHSVSVTGDVALIGANHFFNGIPGAAYVYRFNQTIGQWVEQAKLTASDGAEGDFFGASVSISPDGMGVIGARGDGDAGAASGSAYVFRGLADCNHNGALDLCDIADDTSPDANANGIPDECEPPDCPADLDGDGDVGILDVLALLAAWGTDPSGPPDFDGDGTVGILDLLTLLANWGPCP